MIYSIGCTTNIISQWWDEWKSAPVVNSSLVDDPTIRQQGFDLLRHYWAFRNHFQANQGLCASCQKKWGPCSTWHVPLWQTPNDVTYCQQLPTVQAGGGCSDCTQLNGWRHTARKCTRQQQQLCHWTKHPNFYYQPCCVHIVPSVGCDSVCLHVWMVTVVISDLWTWIIAWWFTSALLRSVS